MKLVLKLCSAAAGIAGILLLAATLGKGRCSQV